ncbi:hypothetical protein VHUM_03331 [Vanrija humicola]|uniref:Dymeclin n=1 Tax=Vanrija humicola TaxID=5417 RepID=A0A7D8YXV0_VANHU|nr:hypothetical protein VHUM_03331 [Vanrija humicola]
MFRNLPTFKSLPQAIGLPFLSSQEDALLTFKSGVNGVKRLSGDEVIPLSDEAYWSQYWTLFSSAADVYNILSAADVRQALASNPTNVANLVEVLSQHLFALIPSDAFPGSNAAPETGKVPSTLQALNCLRVLGRVIVVVYEAQEEGVPGQTWADEHLFSRKRVKREARAPAAADENQFTIADDDDDDEDEDDETDALNPRKLKASLNDPLSNPAPAAAEGEGDDDEANTELLPSLADRLFSAVIDLLFCAGFSVPESVRGIAGSGDKINYIIWEKGVGSTVSIGSTPELDRNKVEVLRFLLVLVSNTIYTPPSALQTTPNPPLAHMTHDLERRLVLSLLCSLLNTSLATPKADATTSLPYANLVFRGSDERRTLVRTCLMTLLVALDYRSFDDLPGLPPPPGGPPADAVKKDDNAFRFFISKLHRKDDLEFVLSGILSILEEHHAVKSGYLPGSRQPIPYILEAFMLLWRLVDLNKRFKAYLFESGKAVDIVGYIILCCLEYKNDPAQHGLLRLLAYLLQTLSVDPAFGTAINQPLRQTVPSKWAVQGSTADFMITSIYSIATTPGLNPLFPALTIAIANSAPSLRHLGVQASTRLMQLFKAFSSPNFLLADEGHPRLVYYLLETFNSILYHQLNENPNLVYAILQKHQDFQTLATFTLMSGLRDIQRRKNRIAAAEERNAPPRSGLVRTNSELAMLAEKAALLGREIDDDEGEGEESSGPRTSESSPAPLASNETTPTKAGMSEKARGKMRATEPASDAPAEGENDVTDEELLNLAAGGIGPNGYVPTQEWVTSWQKGLPLDPVLVAISELLPKIQDSMPAQGAPSAKVFNILKGASLDDVLPPAQPFVPRKFQWSPQSCVWLTSLLWGDVYVANLTYIGAWRDTSVRLFGVKQAPAKGRAAQVDRMLKMIGVA